MPDSVIVLLVTLVGSLVMFVNWKLYEWFFSTCAPRLLRWSELQRQIRVARKARQHFSAPLFEPTADTNWGALVSAILDVERCTFDALLPGGPLGSDLIANAVNAQRYTSDNSRVFGILRVHRGDLTDASICNAMQLAARLLHAARSIPYEQAVIVDPKIIRRLPIAANTKYFAEGFVPNPDLKRLLSEYVPGYSDDAYKQAIDDQLSKCKKHWMRQTFEF